MPDASKAAAFREMHKPGAPFIIANVWDAGSARMLEGVGFAALATTSSGFALTKGRKDYGVTREDALAHCREVADAVAIPVSADLENGWARDPVGVAQTITLAAQTGLAGGSIEDASGDKAAPVFDLSLAVERISAAAEAARAAPGGFVLTARAESYLWQQTKLDDVIARLVAFEEAGADVLFAPGLPDMEAVRELCAALAKPVNVLIHGKLAEHSVAEFGEAGAARLSVGGSLAYAAYSTLIGAKAMLDTGGFDGLKGNASGEMLLRDVLRE